MTQSLLQIPLDIPDVRIEKVETTPKGSTNTQLCDWYDWKSPHTKADLA